MTAPSVKPPGKPPAAPPPPAERSPYERALSLLPAAVCVLWFTGVLRMHGYDAPPLLLGALAAIAFTVQWLLARRRSGRRPLYLLPGSTVAGASARSAALVAAAALVTGAVIETQTPTGSDSIAPLWLCALWHGACGFAIAYLLFVRRYRPPPTRAAKS
jgi:lysylphosphatidylglycerol synthetase-like protein (DUF2156 family)